MFGVDYSFSRPSIDCLWNSGFRFAVRYTSNINSSKNASKSEVDALIRRGFKVVIVHQNGTGDMLQGFSKGRLDAQHALAKTRALGMPSNRPIYFALDRDPNPLSNSQIAACRSYLDGAASVLGRNRVGVYAGYRGIELLCPHWAPWGWQTYAWSGGRISSKAHFRQYRNGVNLCGGQVDYNRNYKTDFGQWPLAKSKQTDPEPKEEPEPEKVLQEEMDMAIEIYADNRPRRMLIGGNLLGYKTAKERAELIFSLAANGVEIKELKLTPKWFDRLSTSASGRERAIQDGVKKANKTLSNLPQDLKPAIRDAVRDSLGNNVNVDVDADALANKIVAKFAQNLAS